MVYYIRAKCTNCENIVVLEYEFPPPPVEEGDFFEGRCPACKTTTTFKAIKRYG